MLQPWDDPTSKAAADYAACRALIKQGSRSFYAASLLLPVGVRMPACAIYAFCRLSDDAVDHPDARRDAIDHLRERLDRAYRGDPRDFAADRAFADVIERFAIPRTLPEALLEGLDWDSQGRICHTLSDLFAYSARVAAAVGAMMTVLMGVRDQAALARACDLGVAMQLTNIARDVGEDARNGRVYLPREWLATVGLDADAFIANPTFDDRVAHVVQRLLDEAEWLYRRSSSGIASLPLACRPAIHAARLIYREIGEEVRRKGYDSISTRAVVSDRRKLALLGSALAATQWTGRADDAPALTETRYLVDAVPPLLGEAKPGMLVAALRYPFVSAARIDRRVGRMIEIIAKADESEKRLRGGYNNQQGQRHLSGV